MYTYFSYMKYTVTVSQLEIELKSVKQKLIQEQKLKTTFETKVEAYKNLMAERDLQMQRFLLVLLRD